MNTSSFNSSDSGGGGNKKRKAITPPISAPIIAAKIPATTATAAAAAAVSGCVTTTLESNNPNNNDKKKKNNPPSSSVEIVDLRDFLKALPKTKLTLRAKTHVQLEIIDITTTTPCATASATATKNKKKKMKSASKSSTSSSCHVVISGAMDLKNLNQLIAYLTGHTQDYNYHSQKGKALKGSFFLLNHHHHPNDDNNNNNNNNDNNNYNNLTIGEKSLAKTLGAEGRHHVVDKDIKITQIFQGLITGPTSGIVYDSNIAKNIQLIWKSNQQQQGSPTYKIVCTGILANKCLLGKQEPLPRVVNNVIGNGLNTINRGFMNGQFLYRTNDVIRGDRKSPPKLSFGIGGNNNNPRQRTNENAAKPIVNADDGSAIQRPNDDDDDDDIKNKGYDIQDLMTKAAFEQNNIESAGLPTSLVSGTTS